MRPHISVAVVLMTIFVSAAYAQYGSIDHRALNYLNSNRVRTVFYNTGLMGNIGEISFEWPRGTGNEYIGDFSPLLGVRFDHPVGNSLASVCTPFGPRGSADGPPGGGVFWGFEPIPGFHRVYPGENPLVAMSDQPDTWPESWDGRWLGQSEPSEQWAEQESYFQMDDNADMEWRSRLDTSGTEYRLYAFPDDSSRGGLGLRVEARYLEFDRPILEDMIMLMYIIHNDGEIAFDTARFGFMVGTLAGGRQDSEDDLAAYNAEFDVAYSFDPDDQGSAGWVHLNDSIDVGVMGTFFVKTPGNLGITSFEYFSPPSRIRMGNDNELWTRLTPGRIEEPDTEPQDGDYIFGTGDFQLLPGATDTIIAVVAYGVDTTDVFEKAEYVRELYSTGQIMDVPEHREPSVANGFLLNAYPNPFNSTLAISLTVPLHQDVTVALYDLLGREVDVLQRGRLSSTTLNYTAPSTLASGIYFARATTSTQTAMQKVVLLK